MTTSLFIFAKLTRSFTLLATIVGAIKWLYLKAPSFSFHALNDEGLFFVGIDVINGMLSEINVTSPTGLREIENLSNKNVSVEVIEKLVEII